MKKIREKIEEFFAKTTNRTVSPLAWSFGFLSIIAIRMFIEFFVSSKALLFEEIVIEYIHNFYFFSISLLLIWLILGLILRENPSRLSIFIIWVSWLIMFPPVIDMIKTGGDVYWSFYALNGVEGLKNQFLTFFGHLPPGIVYFGTRIVFISAIILSASLVYVRSKNWLRTVLSALLVYGVLFFMGSFPSFFTFAYYFFQGSKKISAINEIDIVQLIGTPARLFGTEFNNLAYSLAQHLNLFYYLFLLAILLILFFAISKEKFVAVLKNFRLPQICYHTGLFFIGLGLGFLAYPENSEFKVFSVLAAIVLIAAIWLAWKASVIVNDIYDFEIDQISNPDRPLQKKVFTIKEYAELGVIIFLLSLLGGLTISVKFAAILFVYQIIAWAYSAPPYRLKRFPIIATLVSSIASLVVLFAGFTLVSGDANIHGLSWRIIFLLLGALTLSLPIKDFKDIAGDKKYGVFTVPVIFGEERGRIIVAAGVFVSFMLSVFLLNELRLFWWALLFGALSFLIIAGGKKTQSDTNERSKFSAWINPRKLFWWILGTVGVYGLILAKIVFL